MATKYDAILLYSDDIWNNDREKDFTQAKVIGKGEASESECETFFPCGLYYEKGTTDDTGYQCLSITSEDMDVQGTKMTVISVTLRNPAGQKITLQYPEKSRKFPVQFGGLSGSAITFYIDGAETYRSSKNAKVKAKKFIEARIEKLRACDAPFAAESMEMGMEEMASEFSVERINPTPVSGKADMKAESFGAEENLAVADVDIHDGMNIPAGSGAIIGQAIPETDFTPFGASAESFGAETDEEKCSKCENVFDESEYFPIECVVCEQEVCKECSSYQRDENDEWDWDKPTCFDCLYPDQEAESFGAENPPVPADPRVSPLNKGLHTPSDTPDLSAEYDFQNQTITTITADNEDEARETFAGNYDSTKEEWKIVDVRKAENMGLSAEENLAIQDVEIWDGMVLPEGTGNVMGQMTPTTDFTPFGVSAEQAADPMPNESAIVGQTSDGTPYTRFGYAAESYMEETFKPDGMGEVVGAITAETDYTPFGASAEDMEAEAFGGDLASLNDYNGVESVRVEAPLGHGVTENLGAEEMDTYGGLMGVAAAFIAGMAFSHWSNGKTNGDDAPDSETPSEESDDAPQA
ncbi:hypothetical protein [Planktomarina sp.]|uniref:hypothetical protein n=1 Tax=Planktomarina sp. TaxID=2024851 RepID=UPI000C8F2F86|nr:hypothetical protein [Paracoccaceae bacterium]|tara:strand:+ start:2421 stop:4163 length:1743 start_codon:yes stop_codon:yes gene_type:complete